MAECCGDIEVAGRESGKCNFSFLVSSVQENKLERRGKRESTFHIHVGGRAWWVGG